MTEFEKNNPLVQRIWDRLRTLIGAKVFNIKSSEDLEKVAKRYKTLSGYEKSGLIKKSNLFQVIKEKKMQTFVRGYKTSKGTTRKGYYRQATIRWTPKEIKSLKTYNRKGRTINQMSHYLSRSPKSIKTKLKRLS